MQKIGAQRESLRPRPVDAATLRRVAIETYSQNEAALRRIARRYSLCADDAEDALQRGLEILLTKAPSEDPRELIKWTQTVVKHEALAVRRERERILAGPAAVATPEGEDWVALLPAAADGPAEQAERREEIARSREALRALKPQELRALTLLAQGYSYAEIGEITRWSHTKINRCLAEGRERFRGLIARSEAGDRCAEMQPLLSAFCDGEADSGQVTELREHLRACAHCRATLRTYRAAPGAAAALAPVLPFHRSLWERLQEAVSGMAGRGGGEAASQIAGGSATGGAALVKVVAVCIGTAGGAAACVAGGLVPAPLDFGAGSQRPALERRLADTPAPEPAAPTPQVEYEPAPGPGNHPKPDRAPEREPAELEPVAEEPASPATVPVESAPVAEPVAEPPPAEGGGSPAGEFGP